MKVERVYTRSVVGATRSSSAQQAAETMRRFHVGALLVMEDDVPGEAVAGIVTDRDLAMQVIAEGLDARKVRVEQVMSPVVASIDEEADLHEALERMRSIGVRRLLVTKDGAVAGLLSVDDIVDGLVSELASFAAIKRNELRREALDFDGPRAAA